MIRYSTYGSTNHRTPTPQIMRGELEKLPPRHVVSRETTGNGERRVIKKEPRITADLEKLQGRLATEIYLDPLEAEYRELQELRERVGKAEAATALRKRHQA
jgi:hypothetical protein